MTANKTWIERFEANAKALLPLDWADAYRLDETERTRVGKSLAIFQRGESSDGARLKACALKYAQRHEAMDYYEALLLLIGEEHRHSRDLARFLDLQGLPRVQAHWSDDLFRRFRAFGKLETAVTVLSCAELIAAVYYEALKKATRSPLLQQLCTQITQDEDRHIAFQAAGLRLFFSKRNAFANRIARFCGAVLLAGSCAAVWLDHRGVFRAGGYAFPGFVRASFSQFKKMHAQIAVPEEAPALVPHVQPIHPAA